MSQPTLELEGISIVFLGSFNPQIFQPAWFSAEGLLRKEEAEAIEINVIHREIVSFQSSWLQLQVRSNQFILSTEDSSFYEPLRDLALGTFQLLRHTPIQKMGIKQPMKISRFMVLGSMPVTSMAVMPHKFMSAMRDLSYLRIML